MVPINKIVRILLIITGFVSFGIGVAGVILPVLPGGPFFIFAAYCFGKSSERIENRFKSTTFYKDYVIRIKENTGMTRREKIRINLIADAFIIFSVIYVDIIFVKVIIIILGLIKHYYFIKVIPTLTLEEAKLVKAALRNR